MNKFYTHILLLLNCLTAFGITALPPTATISGGTTLCQNATGSVITFTGSGGTAPYTFTYTINNGTQTQIVTTGTNNTVTLPIVTSTAGTFTYTLVNVSDSNTPTVVIPQNDTEVVTINALPVVNFSFTNNNSCSGTAIQFTPSVTGSGSYTYLWDFGDGTPTSTSQNPSHIFNSLGCGTTTFNVVLTVTSNGCSVSRTNQVIVLQRPDINFSDVTNPFDPFSNCSNASSNPIFTINVGNNSTSTCISSFSINWGDGNIESNVVFPISHTYNSIGAYSMIITAVGNNGCVNTKTYIIKNVSNPLGGLNSPGSTQNLCAPTANLQFSISNWGSNSLDTTYNINYGDGSPPLILNQNQLNSSTYYNSTNPASSLNYPIPHTYLSSSCPATSFIVTLDVTNACGTTPFTLGNISILTKPTANFTSPPSGCVNSSITFNNTTISGYGQGCVQSSIYTWNFGDGTPIITTPLSPPTNINHTFSTPGTYTVTLTAQNFCGITTISKTICIEPPLTPTFTLNTTTGCAPLAVTTTNTTNTTNSCNPPTYLWQVAYTPAFCGTTITPIPNQTTANANFNFVESGTYTITLSMTNSCGTFTSQQTVTVKKPPTVSIAALTSYCGSASINPVATVTNCAPSSSTLTYAWSFPGGTPSTANTLNPGAINYTTPGNYTVSLVVTNECGASNTTSQTLVINQSPVITNTNLSQTICSGTATTPVNITTNPATATFTWTATATAGISGFTPSGTTNTIPAQTISTTSTSPGTVTYVITPTIGTCTGTSVNYIVTVNPAAQVNQPLALSVCNDNLVTPPIFTTSNTSTGTTFSWTNSNTAIGLAASGNGNLPAFTAVNTTNTPITSTITVTPSFSGGSTVCSGVAKTFTITVNPTGQVNQPNNIINCNSSNVLVNFSSSNSGGTTIYNWTNDTTAIGLPASGTGNLNFTATNTTNNPLTATITVTPTYTVGTLSCVGTPKTFTITINPSAQVNQPTAVSVCNGITIPTIIFSTQNTAGTTTYTWTNSNPSIGLAASGTGDLPSFTAINNGTTIVNATIIVTPSILTGTTSCSGTSKQFEISVLPNASLVATPNKTICNGSPSSAINFSSTTTGGTISYSWTNDTPSIGLTSSGTGNIPNFVAINTGLSPITATISVTPSFTSGSLTCSGLTQTFTITVNPSAQVNSTTNIEVCNGNTIPSTVFLTANLVGTTTYSWTNSNTAIGLAANGNGATPSFIASNTTSTVITSTITVTPTFTYQGVNCTGPNQIFTIKVNPSPIATISGTTSVCLNATNPQITFTGSSGNAPYTFTYNLNGGTNQTITTTSGNSVSINAPTNVVGTFTYNLVNIQDSNATSCVNTLTQSAIITVNNAPTIDTQPSPSQSVCVGGTIANPLSVTFLNGTGTASYQWYSNTTNSNSGGTLISGATNATYAPSAFNTAGTFYYYVVISFTGNGCGNISSAVASIDVLPDPVLSTQPLASQTLCQNETPTTLTVTPSGGIGTFNYQWFSTTTAATTGGIAVGTNTSSFTPPTNAVGTFYYYCEITQTGIGCSVTSNSATVIVNSSPTIVNQPISSTVCQNGTPTTLSYTYNNGVGTPTYEWYSNTTISNIGGTVIPGETNATYNPPSNAIGTFYYYGVITFPSLVGSCSSISTNVAVVTINPQSTVDVQPQPTQSICVGGTIANPLSVTFLNGTGTASYQWYSNSTNSNSGGTLISGATSSTYLPTVFANAGTFYYYVILSFTGNGCGNVTSDVANVVVLPDPIVSTQPIASQTLCQNATPNTLQVTATGGIGTFNYQWYSNSSNSNSGGTILIGETNATFTPPTLNNGTVYYYCEITQPNGIGCNVTSATSEINVNLAPAISTNPVSETICLGATITPLSVNYINGVGTPTYQWYSNTSNSNNGGLAILNETNASFSPPASLSGTFYYYCVITFPSLNGGCEIITSSAATIIINQIPVISSQNQTICSGATFTIIPVTTLSDIVPIGTLYTWSAPIINPVGTITGSSAQPVGQTEISQTLINTSTAPATATYTITPISGNCVGATFTITITINPAMNPNAVVTNSTCFGINNGSITTNTTGGIPFTTGVPYTIQWTGPNGFSSSNANISNLVPGTYNLSITDAGGCPIANSYTITEPSDIVLSTDSNTNITCFGSNNGSIAISVIGGTGAYSYSWTQNNIPYATTEDISNLSPATYVVTVSDANNCGPKTATFVITEPPLLQVNLVSQTNINCYGFATGAINSSVIGGTPIEITPGVFDYNYSWTGPNGYTSSNQNISNLIAGNYNLTVTDAQGCVDTLSVTLTQSSEIIINAITTPIVCYGDNNATIAVTLSGGNAPYQVQWSNLAVGLNQNNLSPGNYTITVTDALGCQKSSTINIPSPPLFDVSPVATNISCFGANDGSIVLNFVGGIAPVNLVWSDGSTAGTTRNNLGPGTYSVVITDSKPCTITRTFTILEPQLLVLSANTVNALDCNNANSGQINLLVSGGTPPFSYLWNNGATTEDLNSIPAGNYQVTVTDARGCIKTAQYSITRPNPLVLSVNTTTNATCSTFTVTQDFTAVASGGVPPYIYNWSSGTVSGTNNQSMTTTTNGLVTLTVIDAIGCSTNYSLNVDIPTLGNPSFNTNSIGYTSYGIFSILDPIQFTSVITGDYISVLWDFGDGTFSNEVNPIHTYSSPNDYVVTQTVTYPFGCVYSQIITLKVEKGYLLVVPTAFTPTNNDGINDTFRPVTKGLKNVRLDIYDTWGSLIYSEVGEVLVGWNGKIKEVNSENGNYYAKVSGETFYGTIINENQTFVLIK
jgi:gliding motility-associated-like protein